ncbi:helix-turn-helix transcriptional regulator [Parafrankia sp. BMG5.11]|uniref:helix-turn-helix transcriptional regulator n=1 Tax=Parafrankia sp. BMG5.11 TaxID=222540 RepID=UPI00103E1795|nr:helix-turn-helix transcriptional regulator [Parafrankia sp. BMG5.11]TCJ32431.1 XRE family transcriptional regulator [Parafrankia sp. BMG5.11]
MTSHPTYVRVEVMAPDQRVSAHHCDMPMLLGAEIKRHRTAARLSQQRLATRVDVDQGLISKIETGAKQPSARLIKAIDDALSAGGELVSLHDQVAKVGPNAGGDEHARIQREMVTVTADRAREFVLSHKAQSTTEAIEQVFDEVRVLALAYPKRSLIDVLGPLSEVQETVFSLLEQKQKPAQAQLLYLLAGVTGGLLGKAAHDLSVPHAAMTHARTAFICADQADHDGLRAWVRGLQSLIAYWDRRPTAALRYAQSGAEFAARSGGTVAAWLPISEARAWAALGDLEQTRTAIKTAESAWERVSPDELDEIGGMCTFSPARHSYYAADALVLLPTETETAESYSARAVAAYSDETRPEWAFGDQAGSHTGLALARIARGDLDGAADAIVPVLDLVPEQRINGVVHSVQRLHRAIASSSLGVDPAARDLQEEIETFTRTPAALLQR